ncbi:hypothetical protein [Smaragdicoccus niigatensis]|uniref:hypothetical protein n=1 Tax=Smaragdicoccus niigatensis TaxID=359359 RepID=UPI0003793376|nr:hypothetical protein [Smaragdicoccus niigatensis]
MQTTADGLRSRSFDLIIYGAALVVAGFAIPLPLLWALASVSFAAGVVLGASASLVRVVDNDDSTDYVR